VLASYVICGRLNATVNNSLQKIRTSITLSLLSASHRRRSTAQERREAAETFSLLSSDNPLKTLDSKEQKKGKGTKRKEKKAKPLFKESV
jgi:hypothetical protein